MERAYESMLILWSDLTDEQRKEVFDKIAKCISDLGGKVSKADVWAQERNFFFPPLQVDIRHYVQLVSY